MKNTLHIQFSHMDEALILQLVSNCIKMMYHVYIINRYETRNHVRHFAIRNPFCNMSKNDYRYINHSDIQSAKFFFEFRYLIYENSPNKLNCMFKWIFMNIIKYNHWWNYLHLHTWILMLGGNSLPFLSFINILQ